MSVEIDIKLGEERVRPQKSEVERLWAAMVAEDLLDWMRIYLN